MKWVLLRLLAAAAVIGLALPVRVVAQDVNFDIVRFEIEGNTLLAVSRLHELTAPFIGRRKVYGDLQRAVDAVEREYRRLGYGTVSVYLPEQELTTGVIRLEVSEASISKIEITGNKLFDADNIRAALPHLKEGVVPNMRQLSENVQLSNENPAKQVEVTLGVSDEEGKVDLKINVREEDPDRINLTLDNTGTRSGGKHRVGLSYQHANMGNRDQVLTMGYTTVLDAPQGVKVDIFSLGYRVPLYSIGDSIDIIYGNSSSNTPASVIAPGGTLAINGKGIVGGLRYNHIFPREGEYSSRLVMGLDYKYMNSRCSTAGVPTPIDPPGISSSCTPYTVRPVTATYSGQWQRPGELVDFNTGFTHNLFPMGSRYPFPVGGANEDRYSFVTGRQVPDRFTTLKLGGSYSRSLPDDWLARAVFTGQYASTPVPAGEQLGLTGSATVRGFLERAVAADRGYIVNLEVYSPDYAGSLGVEGTLKGLVFLDWASGHNFAPIAGSGYSRANVASAGVGVRYNLKKDISARFDLVRVIDGQQATPGTSAEAAKPGDIRGHFGLAYGF